MKMHTGVPEAPSTRKKFPTVTGHLEEEKLSRGGNSWTQQFIRVEDDISVPCTNIREANRREKQTRLI